MESTSIDSEESRSPLDNPIWNSLTSRHRHLAIGDALARRYPPYVAPFVAIPGSSDQSMRDLLRLVEIREIVGILNVHPESWQGWEIQKSFDIAQYVWDREPSEVGADVDVQRLGDAHLDQMLELTALVYPAYFRKGTAELGDYFGIIEEDRLCAMAGTRMAMEGYQEISAICTHPNYRGRGFASRLTAHVIQHIQGQDSTPFLHTEADNLEARKIYDRLGFGLRAMLPFFIVERSG